VSNIFRDATEGATARRADLLRRRRDELVMMPHAIRRVFVARRARTAASLAIALVGGVLLVIAAKPAWAAFLAKGLPGINPAVLCTLIIAMWLVGLFTYFAARAFDEHRFAVAMSRLVMPGADVNEDVERLSHENPDQAARDMAHRLEVTSAALPVLAAGVLIPVTALYAGAIYRTGGWPPIAQFEAAVAIHAKMLLGCAALGVVLAIAMTKRVARLPVVAPIMMALALTPAVFAPLTTLWLVPIAMLFATVALVVRTLRVERDLLQAEDPAAGSEIFTIRGFIRQVRASLAPIVTRARSVRPVWAIVAGLLVTAGLSMSFLQPKPPSKAHLAAAPVAAQQPIPDLGPSGSKWSAQPTGDGRLEVRIDLVDGRPIGIGMLGGLSHVPTGWSARIWFDQVEGLPLQVGAIASETTSPLSIESDAQVTIESCSLSQQPLGVRVQGAPGHYVLYLQPVLTPTSCAP
jgi:hypothetical protein